MRMWIWMWLGLLVAGCQPGQQVPAVTYGVGFMGATAQVTVGGFTVAAPVVPAAVTTPVLMVPAGSAVSGVAAAVATNGAGEKVVVPVQSAEIDKVTLFVPPVNPSPTPTQTVVK